MIFTETVPPRMGYVVSELGMLFTSVRISMSKRFKADAPLFVLQGVAQFCQSLLSKKDEVTLPPMDIPEHNIGYIESQQNEYTNLTS